MSGGHRLGDALSENASLAHLMQRVHASRERSPRWRRCCPEPLRAVVRPGPLDEQAWVLLAEHAAAAAKLRQLLPVLQAALLQAGWAGPEVKVKIQPKT